MWDEAEGEARNDSRQGTQPSAAQRAPETPAKPEFLMEVVVGRENMEKALKRVMANRGSPGADGMKTSELPGHLEENWGNIKKQLLDGTYRPTPVKRVEIPKPKGGTRPLGIPTALDRLVQQAIAQVLTPIFDPAFSDSSYGFRPKRSTHQAVERAQGHIKDGYTWVVDMDIEAFFDNVNHDMLMARVARRIDDKRCLRIIRAFLNSGVMEGGLVSPTRVGTPQGGPLSPLLSNIFLDDLDKELEERGHRFVRYADDCNVYVASERAGRRVMDSITRFLAKKLKLKVSEAKSAVTRPFRMDFLGFSFTRGKNPKRRISPGARERLKKQVRELTRRSRGVSLEQMIAELNRYLRGWRAYFGFCQTPSVLQELDSWIRRRLRTFIWNQMRNGRRRYAKLRSRGVSEDVAARTAASLHGPRRMSHGPAMCYAFPNAYFITLGLVSLELG